MSAVRPRMSSGPRAQRKVPIEFPET